MTARIVGIIGFLLARAAAVDLGLFDALARVEHRCCQRFVIE